MWRFVRIHWIHENRLNLWKLTGFVIKDSKQIFLSQDSWSMIRYKSRICFVRHVLNLFGVRICDHDTIWIHVFMNLLYNSRNLNQNTFDKNFHHYWIWCKVLFPSQRVQILSWNWLKWSSHIFKVFFPFSKLQIFLYISNQFSQFRIVLYVTIQMCKVVLLYILHIIESISNLCLFQIICQP